LATAVNIKAGKHTAVQTKKNNNMYSIFLALQVGELAQHCRTV
jgi:hypothetical protein